MVGFVAPVRISLVPPSFQTITICICTRAIPTLLSSFLKSYHGYCNVVALARPTTLKLERWMQTLHASRFSYTGDIRLVMAKPLWLLPSTLYFIKLFLVRTNKLFLVSTNFSCRYFTWNKKKKCRSHFQYWHTRQYMTIQTECNTWS